MTLLKDNDYKEINVALLSLEADIKNKITNFDTSVIDRQLAEINSRIDKINAGGNNSSAEINDVRTEIENINSKLNANSTEIENIEQKLSDIFSAENKVTDFNTTTGSGIYYWVNDAANKPGTDYGVLLVNKYDSRDNAGNLWINQIAYGTNSKIYFRQNINSGNWTEWKAVAFTTDVKNTTTKTFNLNAVSTRTKKYIKLGTFHWYDTISFRCELYGNCFQDVVNINTLGGNSLELNVCGYYSTNSRCTEAIIVKRGDTWSSNNELYLQVSQLTDLGVNVTIDEEYQDRINISESTTVPSGSLETLTFNNYNGIFSNNIDTKCLTISGDNGTSSGFGKAPLSIGFPSGTGDGQSLSFDRNSIQANANDAANVLYLNYYGGIVSVNGQSKSDGGLKVNNKLVIPIGAPSSLENGCIWIS